MENSPNCLTCGGIEDYEHVFVNCLNVQVFWRKIVSIFKTCGIERDIQNLKTLVVGYKITHTDYFYVNIFLTIVGFCIYKSYFLSENWTLHFDIYKVFIQEVQILLHLLKHRGLKNSFVSRVEKVMFP